MIILPIKTLYSNFYNSIYEFKLKVLRIIVKLISIHIKYLFLFWKILKNKKVISETVINDVMSKLFSRNENEKE